MLGIIGPLLVISVVSFAQDVRSLFDAWWRHGLADYGYTRSMEPVKLELRVQKTSIHLSIAKAYLTFKPNWAGGRQDFLVMEAALPELNPAILDKREMVPAEDRVFIRLHASIPGGTTKFVREKIDWLQGTSQDERFAWYHERNIVDPSGTPHVRPSDTEYALPLEQVGDPRTLFSCVPSAPDRKVGCIVYTEVIATSTVSIDLNYQIRRSELPRWHEIDSAVRKLVTSFVDESEPKN